MTVLWSNDDVIFKDGDVVWKPHETDVQVTSSSTSIVSGSLDSQPGLGSSITEISGIAATLASFEVLTDLVGSIAGTSGADGILDSQSGLGSAIVEISGASGSLGAFEIATQLVGLITGTSGADSILDIVTELQGSAIGASGADAYSSILWILQGSAAGASDADGVLDLQPECIGSVAGTSGADGFLDSQPGLGSSVVEISGIAATLASFEVLTDLVGSIAGTSGADGALSVVTELGSSIVEISGASGSLGSLEILTLCIGLVVETSEIASAPLDSQPGCVGSVIGLSALPSPNGYLTIVPDFDAATLSWRPQGNIIETLEWKTSILKSHNGTEQRIKIRQTPRQLFRLHLILETDQINTKFDSIIHAWQKLAWLIPVWTEYVTHTGDINAKDESIQVDTTYADFRGASKAIVWKSSTEYEVVVIDTKTDSQLNLSYSMLNSFTGDKYIIPVRTAYLISSSKKEKSNSPVSIVDLIFAVYDNIEIDGYTPSMNYDSFEVLDTPAFMSRTHSENSDADIFISDFETGIFKIVSNSDFNRLSQDHNFFNATKEDCWNFRKFLHSLDGRQKTVLIPTFREDLIQTDDINPADVTVNIENIGLADNMGFNDLRTYIGFYFPSTGALIVRKIVAISEVDIIEEQITIDANLGLASAVASGDCKICFVDKCRLASDKIQIRWPFAHRQECRTNFIRVS